MFRRFTEQTIIKKEIFFERKVSLYRIIIIPRHWLKVQTSESENETEKNRQQITSNSNKEKGNKNWNFLLFLLSSTLAVFFPIDVDYCCHCEDFYSIDRSIPISDKQWRKQFSLLLISVTLSGGKKYMKKETKQKKINQMKENRFFWCKKVKTLSETEHKNSWKFLKVNWMWKGKNHNHG